MCRILEENFLCKSFELLKKFFVFENFSRDIFETVLTTSKRRSPFLFSFLDSFETEMMRERERELSTKLFSIYEMVFNQVDDDSLGSKSGG